MKTVKNIQDFETGQALGLAALLKGKEPAQLLRQASKHCASTFTFDQLVSQVFDVEHSEQVTNVAKGVCAVAFKCGAFSGGLLSLSRKRPHGTA